MKSQIIGLCMAGAALGAGAAERIEINGAGGSFPAPLYQAWAFAYTQGGYGAKVNYQSVGSSAGISQIKAGTVDFAGTDAPLSEADCKAAGLRQFHMVSGAVVAAVNLPGVGSDGLVLDGGLLADIFRGKVDRWNDARIAALNPGLSLPDLKITTVHRGDGSGTTHIFSSYLADVSDDWKREIGAGTLLKWPCGIAGQKNPGVCNSIRRIRGAIGYTEYTFALESKLAIARLKVGDQVASPDSAQWPILGKTYILTREDTPPERMSAMQDYFRWCFDHGGETAAKLHYVPVQRQ
ncbi:MAG: phosphate ABC transporter substrate-binding protein PstS [Kiritimatiellia bacterium]